MPKKNLDTQLWLLTLCNLGENSLMDYRKKTMLTYIILIVQFVYYFSHGEPLCYVTQDSMTVDDMESLLKDTEHNGFPVVVSHESPFLVGFVLRKDLNLAISNMKSMDGVDGNSLVLFTNHPPANSTRADRVILIY